MRRPRRVRAGAAAPPGRRPRARRLLLNSTVPLACADASPGTWSLPDFFSEQVAHVRWVRKAAFHRNLAQRIVRNQQQALCTFDTAANDILVRRAAKALLEGAFELE